MGLSVAELRQAWKEYECQPALMKKVAFGPDQIRVAPPTIEAWNALSAVLKAHNYHVRVEDTDSYNCRNMKSGKTKSLHSYGIALDLNWNSNPWRDHPGKRSVKYSNNPTQRERGEDVKLGRADTDMTQEMIDDVRAIHTRSGKRVFVWGGDWKSVKDCMHFEIALAPGDLEAGVDWSTVCGAPAGAATYEGGERGYAQAQNFVSPGKEYRDMTANYESELSRPAVPGEGSYLSAARQGYFSRVQPIIDKWEGGYVDHPSDPGGATNMGITIRTLSTWRGRPVSKTEVRELTRSEVWQIMKSNYYDVICGDQLPLPVAVVAHNCAVLSGPSWAAKCLQRALGQMGEVISVDGVIGRETLAAVGRVDAHGLAETVLEIQETYLRGLRHWATFGRGWMNRLEDVRQYARSLSSAPIAVEPSSRPGGDALPWPKVGDQRPFEDHNILGILARIEELVRFVRRLKEQDRQTIIQKSPSPTSPESSAGLRDILAVAQMLGIFKEVPADLITGHPAAVKKPLAKPLTAVNSALGETIGRFLDGKKTATGVAGILLTTLLPAIAKIATPLTGIGEALSVAAPIAVPLFSALTGWGVLGKLDKWAQRMKPE